MNIPKDVLVAELRSLADERNEIVVDNSIRAIMEQARKLKLARPCPTGKMKMAMNRRQESVELLGHAIPIVGSLYDVWELLGEARP